MIARVHKTSDYTVLSNYHFKEKDMSLKAKGLLSLMLSLPDDWDFTVEGLSYLSSDGETSVKQALKELEVFGYLERSRERLEDGRLGNAIYNIYEAPKSVYESMNCASCEVADAESVENTDFSPTVDFPPVENPPVENPPVENPTVDFPTEEKPTVENRRQLNTNISNTNISNTNEYKEYVTRTHTHARGRARASEHTRTQTDRRQPFLKPTLEEVKAYVAEKSLSIDAQVFFDYFEEGNWYDSEGKPVKNWKQKAITWASKQKRRVDNGIDTEGTRDRIHTNGMYSRLERRADAREAKDPNEVQKYANAFIRTGSEECEWEREREIEDIEPYPRM